MNERNYHNILFTIIALAVILPACKTQQPTIEKPLSHIDYLIPGNFKLLEIDKLGFTYLVNARNEIMKYDADYNLLFRYSIRSLGDITRLNVSNPQKIFVYYADYNQIILVDNTLSEIKRLDLENLELHNITGATVGRDNFIWLFDNSNLRLLKINESGQIFLSSNEQDPTLRAFIDEMPDLYSYENQIFLNNGEQLAVYDEFGVHQKNISISAEQLQFENNKLLYLEENYIKSQDLQVDFLNDKGISVLKEFQGKASGFHINDDRLLLIDGKGLYSR